jgi:4-hydroxybenzoate polyprenyltransferase
MPDNRDTKVMDISKLRPVIRLMRLHQPTGILLLFWPCSWGLALGSGGLPPTATLILFAVGAVAMRAAGCIVNDLTDRRFDRDVERTKDRPLASGEISVREALILLAILLAVALDVAWLLPRLVLLLACLSLPFIILYPWMKRWTWWPQAFLGLTFNFGALMGWVAAQGSLALPAFLLYAAGIFWTLGYDTIYAHQDKEDDRKVGIKSSALFLGSRSRPWITVFYAISIFLLVSAGHLAKAPPGYFLGIMVMTAHFCRQVARVDFDDPGSCLKQFRSNGLSGSFPFLGMALGGL